MSLGAAAALGDGCERTGSATLTTTRAGRVGNGEGEEVAHWAARVTEWTCQELGQQERTSSWIDRNITAAAGERAGAEHAGARRLPSLLECGLRASPSLERAVVNSAKHAHNGQSRRESFTAPAPELSAQRTSAIQRCERLAGAPRCHQTARERIEAGLWQRLGLALP